MRSEAHRVPSQEQSISDKQKTHAPERALHIVRPTEIQESRSQNTEGDEVEQHRANIDAYLDRQSAFGDAENVPDDTLEFPTLKQAQADVLKAKVVLRDLKADLAWAKDGLKEAESELREAQRVPENRSHELREELERLERMVLEGDPELDDLRAELNEAEEDEDMEGHAEYLEEMEVSYQEALDEVAEYTQAVENAQIELLTCKRILDHVQEQSFSVSGLWGRMRKLFSPATSKKEQEIPEESEDDDRHLKEAA